MIPIPAARHPFFLLASHSRGASPLPSPSLPLPPPYHAQSQTEYAVQAQAHYAESTRSYNAESQRSYNTQTQYAVSQRSRPSTRGVSDPSTPGRGVNARNTSTLASPSSSTTDGYADAFLNTANNGGYVSVRGRQNSESSTADRNGGNTGTINGNGKSSIALRAMKSLAQIGSWAQLLNDDPSSTPHPAISISHPISIPAPSKADLKKEQANEKEREKEKKHNSRPAPSKRTISNPLMLTRSTNPSVELELRGGRVELAREEYYECCGSWGRRGGCYGRGYDGELEAPEIELRNGELAAAQSLTLSANANFNRDKDRASSGSTTSPPVPILNYARSTRLSGASAISSRSAYSNSSGDHTGVGSTYSVSGKDNTRTNFHGFVGTTSKKGGKEDNRKEGEKKSSVKWGGVSIGGLTAGSKRESRESKDSKESKEGGEEHEAEEWRGDDDVETKSKSMCRQLEPERNKALRMRCRLPEAALFLKITPPPNDDLFQGRLRRPMRPGCGQFRYQDV
ncbi:hypothetical protein M422DRAFT_243481 [Sphaerobolus stellatus SS14]|nr:hypothetical protein M422DRAFT_243481 [Sphaerobolus stellatus SS14]